MRLKHRTAIVLATAAATLGAAGSALAMPVRDTSVADDADPVVLVVPAARAQHGSGGTGTPAVVLLAVGALLAGGMAGFGVARVRATRGTLHPR